MFDPYGRWISSKERGTFFHRPRCHVPVSIDRGSRAGNGYVSILSPRSRTRAKK